MANKNEMRRAPTEAIKHSSKVWGGRINAAAGWTALAGVLGGLSSFGLAVGLESTREPGRGRME